MTRGVDMLSFSCYKILQVWFVAATPINLVNSFLLIHDLLQILLILRYGTFGCLDLDEFAEACEPAEELGADEDAHGDVKGAVVAAEEGRLRAEAVDDRACCAVRYHRIY